MIGVALPYVGDQLGHVLSYQEQEIATAATTIGAIFGAAILGAMADRWGRKWCLAIADVLYVLQLRLWTSSLGQWCDRTYHHCD